MTTGHEGWLKSAVDLHARSLVVDTHVDTTQRLLDPKWDFGSRHRFGHVDLPRLREGGVDAVFFAVFAMGPVEAGAGVRAAWGQIERIGQLAARHASDVVLARTADDVRQARRDGRIAVLIAVEGGHLIEDSLDVLREYREAGATYLTLTHGAHTGWADSSGIHEPLAPMHGGLTEFGREVVRELNRLGMMVDVSHVSDGTFRDVMRTSAAPVVATHSSCRAVALQRRNLTDDMIRAIADSGGVVQINFSAGFVDPDFPHIDTKTFERWWKLPEEQRGKLTDHMTPLSLLVDHVDHAVQLVGPEHVGIGSDFDGVYALPEGMEDCSKLPSLTAALLERGYAADDLRKVLGENVLRVMDACTAVARVS
jgi:membrane dipeptidase